jgi:hypothetical protein
MDVLTEELGKLGRSGEKIDARMLLSSRNSPAGARQLSSHAHFSAP